jgi:predicted amino acid dehydrogenase
VQTLESQCAPLGCRSLEGALLEGSLKERPLLPRHLAEQVPHLIIKRWGVRSTGCERIGHGVF